MRFHGCHNVPNPDLIGRKRKTDASATTARGFEEAGMDEIVGDLHQVRARDSLILCNLSDGCALFSEVGKADQQAQGQVGVSSELHRQHCVVSKSSRQFDAYQMHLHQRLLSGI